ncbi:MAG: hypothetical protein ACUVTU_02825 [Desulfurispora sp.]|uniref:hypothetical protein n=1 Tax=Desulfurispora sp. TaxID=3014275 RepID=UPI00404A809D
MGEQLKVLKLNGLPDKSRWEQARVVLEGAAGIVTVECLLDREKIDITFDASQADAEGIIAFLLDNGYVFRRFQVVD